MTRHKNTKICVFFLSFFENTQIDLFENRQYKSSSMILQWKLKFKKQISATEHFQNHIFRC